MSFPLVSQGCQGDGSSVIFFNRYQGDGSSVIFFISFKGMVGPRKPFHFNLHPWLFANSPITMNFRWYYPLRWAHPIFSEASAYTNSNQTLQTWMQTASNKPSCSNRKKFSEVFQHFPMKVQNPWVQFNKK